LGSRPWAWHASILEY
jgi:hypothetical protein